MSFQDLLALVLTAMSVDFTVFGVTFSLYQVFVFNIFIGAIFWMIRFFIDHF